MSRYRELKKSNRLRFSFVSAESQKQIREVMRYIRRICWDLCALEILKSDLLDMALNANKEGNELFKVIGDAQTFAAEVRAQLGTPKLREFLFLLAPFFFYYCGFGGILLYCALPGAVIPVGVETPLLAVVFTLASYVVFSRLLPQLGFPVHFYQIKHIVIVAAFAVAMYLANSVIYRLTSSMAVLSANFLGYGLFNLLVGGFLYAARNAHYCKNPRLEARL